MKNLKKAMRRAICVLLTAAMLCADTGLTVYAAEGAEQKVSEGTVEETQAEDPSVEASSVEDGQTEGTSTGEVRTEDGQAEEPSTVNDASMGNEQAEETATEEGKTGESEAAAEEGKTTEQEGEAPQEESEPQEEDAELSTKEAPPESPELQTESTVEEIAADGTADPLEDGEAAAAKFTEVQEGGYYIVADVEASGTSEKSYLYWKEEGQTEYDYSGYYYGSGRRFLAPAKPNTAYELQLRSGQEDDALVYDSIVIKTTGYKFNTSNPVVENITANSAEIKVSITDFTGPYLNEGTDPSTKFLVKTEYQDAYGKTVSANGYGNTFEAKENSCEITLKLNNLKAGTEYELPVLVSEFCSDFSIDDSNKKKIDNVTFKTADSNLEGRVQIDAKIDKKTISYTVSLSDSNGLTGQYSYRVQAVVKGVPRELQGSNLPSGSGNLAQNNEYKASDVNLEVNYAGLAYELSVVVDGVVATVDVLPGEDAGIPEVTLSPVSFGGILRVAKEGESENSGSYSVKAYSWVYDRSVLGKWKEISAEENSRSRGEWLIYSADYIGSGSSHSLRIDISENDEEICTKFLTLVTPKAEISVQAKPEEITKTSAEIYFNITTPDEYFNWSNKKARVQAYYRVKDPWEKWELHSSYWFYLSKSGTESATLRNLTPGTEYEVKIVSCVDSDMIYGQTSFRTAMEDSYPLATTFPDARLRKLIKEAAGLDENAVDVTAEQLEQITVLSAGRSSFDKEAIKDLTGIDLLTKLTKLDLANNEISDTSAVDWAKLTAMESLNLIGNELEEIPDLSQNKGLKYAYLDENLIPEEAFQTASTKVPGGVRVSSKYTSNADEDLEAAQRSQRIDGLQVAAEKIYYQKEGKSPLLFKVSGYKTGLASGYRITCRVDDETELTLYDRTWDGVWYNTDTGIAVGDHTLVLKIYGGYGAGAEKFTSEEIAFQMEEGRARPDKLPYHFNVKEDNCSVYLYSDRKISALYMQKDGGTVAVGSDLECTTVGCENLYEILSGSYRLEELNFYHNFVRLMRIKNKNFDVGLYDLRVVYEDETEEIVQNAIEMVDKPSVRDVWIGYNYDSTGDYFYLSINGYGFDASKLDYTFTYEGVQKRAQYVGSKETWGGFIVKFEKEAAWMPETGKSVEVKLVPKDGYDAVFDKDTFTAQISEGMYYCAYNEVANKIEVGITSNLKQEDVAFSLKRYGSWDDMNHGDAIETITVRTEAAGVITNLAPIKDDAAYKLPAGYYKVTAECGENILGQKTFSIGNMDYWSGIKHVGKGTGETVFWFYSGVPYVNADSKSDFQAEITGESLVSPLKTKTLTTDSDRGNTRVRMTFNLSTMAQGTYTITLRYKNDELSTYTFTVLPTDRFVITRDDAPNAAWIDDSSFRVSFDTVNVAQSDTYTVSLTDFYGNAVSGLKTEVEKRYTSMVYLKVTGLQKGVADKGYYIKVTHNTLGDAYKSDCTTKFYNDEKGRFLQIGDNKFTWTTENGKTVGVGMYSAIVFPVTLNIYKPYDTELIGTLTIRREDLESETSNPAWYYFKQALVDGLADQSALYDIVVSDSNGNLSLVEKRSIGSRDGAENTWTVSPVQLTLNLESAETATETITVRGSKGTPVFESENLGVATVAANKTDPQKAVVTAVAEGTTNINITADQITKKVAVTVIKETVKPAGITLDAPESASAGSKVRISAFVTPADAWTSQSSMTWSSSDSSVISIPEGRKGTTVEADALKAGTAVITAALDGTELQASCTIKVVAADDGKDDVEKVGTLYFLEGADSTLADIKLPEGWSWKNSGETLKADDSHPVQNFMASYRKDDVSFERNLPVHVSKLDEVRIVGKSVVNSGKETSYIGDYTYVGEDPINGCAISWQWTAGANLELSSNNDRKTIVKASGNGTLFLQMAITNKTTGKAVSGDAKLDITVGEIPESEPILENKKITIYKNSTLHVPIGLVAANGNDIIDVKANHADFKTEQDNNGEWLIWLANGTSYTKKVPVPLELTVVTESGIYTMALGVIVDVTEITTKDVKFKQTVKPNTAYSDTGTVKAEFGVSGKYIIEDITAAPGSGEFTFKSYNPASGTLVLEAETGRLDNSKKSYPATVKVKVRDYGEWTLPVNVAVQNKKPSLKFDTAIILSGVNADTLVALYNGKSQISCEDYTITKTAGDNVMVTKDADLLKVAYTGSKNGNYKVKVRKNTWAPGVEMGLKGKVSVLDPARAKLATDLSKVTINISEGYASPVTVTAGIKGCSAAADLQAVPAGSKDEQALTVENLGDGKIRITPKNGAAKGSYKVNVSGTVNGTQVKGTSVKVILTDKAPTVNLSAKGQINLANREGTSIIYTPKLKNLPETLSIKEVNLDNTVQDSSFFQVRLADDGKAVLTTVAGKTMNQSTKYKPVLIFTLSDGKTVRTDAKFTVKVVNKLPKVTAKTLSGALCKGNAGHKASYKLDAGNGYTINNVTTDDANFKVVFNGGTDTVYVSLSGTANVTTGKKYTVPCKVYIKGADNTTKPRQVKLTVKVY